MAHRIKHTLKSNTDPILKQTSIVLAILGFADAVYLLVLKYTQSEALCVGNHGCITVNTSSYSMIYGIPISLWGLIGYLCIGTALFLESHWRLMHEQGPLFTFGASLIGVIFSAYLTWIELYVIHATCPFCVASAILITLIFILAVIRLVKQTT